MSGLPDLVSQTLLSGSSLVATRQRRIEGVPRLV
jgi:hypothetical protein